jgi:hypothetical protein
LFASFFEPFNQPQGKPHHHLLAGRYISGGPPELDAFRKHLPQEWIEEALRATGTATLLPDTYAGF